MPKATRRTDVQCSFTSTSLTLNVAASADDAEEKLEGDGAAISITGEFVNRVMPGECNWQLDWTDATTSATVVAEGEVQSHRIVWVLLAKAKPTATPEMWHGVLVGDVQLSHGSGKHKLPSNNPRVHEIDSSDPKVYSLLTII